MKRFAKIINQKTREVIVGKDERPDIQTQALWSGWGLTSQEVEQAYDGRWFVKGYAPEAPAETIEDVKEKRSAAYLKETDTLTAEYTRKKILGLLTDERQAEIEAELARLSARIQTLYPYPADQINENKKEDL